MATVELTAENFMETVGSEGIVLVDAWAEWCGPCKAFGPIYESVSETHPEHTFGKLDTEANQQIAASLEIQSIPTIFAFRDGILLFRQAGLLPEAALEDLIGQLEGLDMDEVKKEIEAQMAAEGGAENAE